MTRFFSHTSLTYTIEGFYSSQRKSIIKIQELDMSETAIIKVSGMKCGGCEANVTGKLSAIGGVESVNAQHKEGTVTVTFDNAQTDLDTLEDVIIEAGFKIE